MSRDSEQQQLLPGNIVSDKDEKDEEVEAMSECSPVRMIAGPVVAIILITLLWLAFTGFVVVSPGELAVIVTLVCVYDYDM